MLAEPSPSRYHRHEAGSSSRDRPAARDRRAGPLSWRVILSTIERHALRRSSFLVTIATTLASRKARARAMDQPRRMRSTATMAGIPAAASTGINWDNTVSGHAENDEDAAPPGPETDRCPGGGWASGHSAKCPYR
jgi:hypothetical protein